MLDLSSCFTCLVVKKQFFKKSRWWIVTFSKFPQISIFLVFFSLGIFSILQIDSRQWSFLTRISSFQSSGSVPILNHSLQTSVAEIKSSYSRNWKIVNIISKGKCEICGFPTVFIFLNFFQILHLIKLIFTNWSEIKIWDEIFSADCWRLLVLPAFLWSEREYYPHITVCLIWRKELEVISIISRVTRHRARPY